MDKQELQMAKKLNAGFRVLDDISDMNSSYIHVDWSDIKAAMGGNDLAWSGAGQAEGTDGIVEAAKRAMASFSNDSLKMMNAVCISFACSAHEKLQKVTRAVDEIRACVQPDAMIVWGMMFDGQIDSGGEVTVMGFGRCSDSV